MRPLDSDGFGASGVLFEDGTTIGAPLENTALFGVEPEQPERDPMSPPTGAVFVFR